jgi:hypothetical protein
MSEDGEYRKLSRRDRKMKLLDSKNELTDDGKLNQTLNLRILFSYFFYDASLILFQQCTQKYPSSLNISASLSHDLHLMSI